jgi:hypothetical protein
VLLVWPWHHAPLCRVAQRTPSSINVAHGLGGIVPVRPALSRACALKCDLSQPRVGVGHANSRMAGRCLSTGFPRVGQRQTTGICPSPGRLLPDSWIPPQTVR